ncbi:CD3337/EF1877 family mobilome membrane protein, partial [Bacillus sp. RIT 809]|uniref:CD3337/EF1877 family mobilome membrane protein n=1 Tax=Bacillus sp. RIT 809 TaxID=2803857 RepID=UPI00194ECFE6
MKRIGAIVLLCLFTILSFNSNVAHAEEDTISNHLFEGHTDGLYKDAHYQIDTAPSKDDDKGFFSKAWGYMFGDDSIGKDIQRKIYSVTQWGVDLAFQFSLLLVKGVLFVVDQSLRLDIIDNVADKLGTAMQNIAGVENNGFKSGGLLPSIISLTCALSAFYAAYIFFVKRQPLTGFSEIVKTVLVIAVIVTFISNVSTFLRSANTVSSEISIQILTKATGTVAGDPGRSKEDAIYAVKKQIWTLLTERPYLFMQYGKDSKEGIGEDRVNKLLKTPPGEDRVKIIEQEIKDKNVMMKLDSVGERLIFTIVYYVVNTFTGIPIILLCLLTIAFQLWFMVMSIIAPICMAVALLPGQRRVLSSWATEWIRPLALKIIMSVLLVIVFTISELIYTLPESGAAGYVSTMLLQIVVFVLCYLFRDRLVAAFSASKAAYRMATDVSLMSERAVDYGRGFINDKFGSNSRRYGEDEEDYVTISTNDPEALAAATGSENMESDKDKPELETTELEQMPDSEELQGTDSKELEIMEEEQENEMDLEEELEEGKQLEDVATINKGQLMSLEDEAENEGIEELPLAAGDNVSIPRKLRKNEPHIAILQEDSSQDKVPVTNDMPDVAITGTTEQIDDVPVTPIENEIPGQEVAADQTETPIAPVTPVENEIPGQEVAAGQIETPIAPVTPIENEIPGQEVAAGQIET